MTDCPDCSAPQPEDGTTYHEILLRFHLIDHDQTIDAVLRDEIVMGRTVEGQIVTPNIDLSSFDAYEEGVSRLHAILKLENGQIKLVDLNSSNGTRINGQKVMPQIENLLRNGDLLTLGKLRLQILFQENSIWNAPT